MFEDNFLNQEELNDDKIGENLIYQQMIEQYKQMLNNLRNENSILKYNLDEKSQIIKNFQKVSIEEQEKIEKLNKDNKKLLKENQEMKEKLKKLDNQKKEEKKRESIRIKEDLNSLKQELNTVQNFYSNQLKQKENYINNLQNNYSNLEGQYHQTLKSTLNSCQNSRPLSSNNSKSYLLDNREQKYSFYGNFNDRKSNCNNCSNNNLN